MLCNKMDKLARFFYKDETTRTDMYSWETMNQFTFVHCMKHVILGVISRLNFNNQAR